MKVKIDFEAVKDYVVYSVLMMIFITMVASCLMLIRTQDVAWYGATVISTIIGIVAGSWKFKNDLDLDISETEEEQEQA